MSDAATTEIGLVALWNAPAYGTLCTRVGPSISSFTHKQRQSLASVPCLIVPVSSTSTKTRTQSTVFQTDVHLSRKAGRRDRWCVWGDIHSQKTFQQEERESAKGKHGHSQKVASVTFDHAISREWREAQSLLWNGSGHLSDQQLVYQRPRPNLEATCHTCLQNLSRQTQGSSRSTHLLWFCRLSWFDRTTEMRVWQSGLPRQISRRPWEWLHCCHRCQRHGRLSTQRQRNRYCYFLPDSSCFKFLASRDWFWGGTVIGRSTFKSNNGE